MSNEHLGRRKFIGGAGATAAACVCGFGAVGGCAAKNMAAKPLAVTADSTGRLPLGAAADLAVGQQLKVSAPSLEGPVLVARVSDSEVRAVAIACTHFGSEVAVSIEDQRFRCPSHGSQFAFDGSVLEGPASDPLQSYEVIDSEGQLYLIAPGS